MLAIVCPGQGSQTPGFLDPWLELPTFHEQLTALSADAELDLVHYGTRADADAIKDTAVAQPLIVASGIACLASLLASLDLKDATSPSLSDVAQVVAGHSVGEITASAAAGVMSPKDAVVFVRERGRAMAQAAAQTPTGMAACVGGNADDVIQALEKHGLTAANMNGAGQIVAAGTLEHIEELRADPPAKTRVIPLAVAGAFHTQHMAPAVDHLQKLAQTMTPQDPKVTLLSNKDGEAVEHGGEVLSRLVSQVSNPVRWDLTMETFRAIGVTGLIELAPAGTLVGLAKRGLPGVKCVAIKSPADLDAAKDLIAEHGSTDTSVVTQ